MLARAKFLVRIYLTLQLIHLRAALVYRADFWIGIVGVGLTHGVGIAYLWILFQHMPAINGWSLWEMALLYALAIIPRGLMELLCDGPWLLRVLVIYGEFDRLLVRPVSPALQVITQFTSIHGLGSVLLGGLVLARAIVELKLAWGVPEYVLLTVTLLSGVVVLGALNFATNCIAFWGARENTPFPFMIQQFAEFGKFPLTLYHWLMQLVLTWVLPFACVSYFPGLVLLDKPEAAPWMVFAPPLAGLAMVAVASGIWRRGIGRYQSTGH